MPYAFAARKATSPIPAFPSSAKLALAVVVHGDGRFLRVAFPKADAQPSARAMEYALTLETVDGKRRTVRLLAPGAFKVADDPLAASDPIYDVPLLPDELCGRAEVRPIEVFGTHGEKIEAAWQAG